MNAVLYIDRDESVEAPSDDEFSRWANAALETTIPLTENSRTDVPELSIYVCDEAQMTLLNAQYRGKTGSTNVLSFPADISPDVTTGLLGDIVICANVVSREAQEQQKAENSHWAHMTVHGILHLLGFDHVEDAEAQVMEALETTVLMQLGYPAPYESPINAPDRQRVPTP